MILKLDFSSDIPIYLQIKEQAIKAIATGELKINEPLPSVRSLASEIGINMHTVNKAYNLLKDEGYISIDRRKGGVVSQLPMNIKEESKKQIYDELDLLISKAYLLGMTYEEFINYTKNKFKECRVDEYR